MDNIIVSMHQPNYLPWCGFFHKMTYSDIFVILDHVQYPERTWTNRASIMIGGQKVRLTVPVTLDHWSSTIRDARIDTSMFRDDHLKSLQRGYARSPYYDEVIQLLEPVYDIGSESLAVFNLELIRRIAGYLSLKPRFVLSSTLGITSHKNLLLIDITSALNAGTFVSGTGAKNYIQGHEDIYEKAGIRLAYQNFVHPEYNQLKQPFTAQCSIIDLLFTQGREARSILDSHFPAFLDWREHELHQANT